MSIHPKGILCLLWALLLLIPVQAQKEKKTANGYLVEGLEEIEPAFASFEGTMYAGLMPVSDHSDTAEFMFWLFEPAQPSMPNTMVLWLNGGPGCSSILGGVLVETSPVTLGARASGTCCLSPKDPLQANPYAWTKATTMLYVEMPTGVGYSRGGIPPRNEDDIGRDMQGFLQSFYKVFPNLLPHQLTLFGESYAGYFVPSIAHRIALENQKQKASTVTIPLTAIALGNGWMDASVQGPAVIDYAWWHGMIDAYTRDVFHAEWKRCYEDQAEDDDDHVRKAFFHSFTTTDECGILQAILAASGQGVLPNDRTPNTYDVTSFDPYAIIGSHNSTLTRFMNDPRVQRALHAPQDIQWAGCLEGGVMNLVHDQPVSMMPIVAELLDRWNLRVLLYNGDLDMSTNVQGNELLLNNMNQWSGHQAWKVAGRGIWMTNNAVAGYVKKYANLTFLVVKNSGHLVPLNQPLPALDLVERFLRNVPFLDIPLPSFVLGTEGLKTSLSSKQRPSYLLEEEEEQLCNNEDSKLWLRIFYQVVLAVVCFFAGVLAAHSWRRKGYESVGSVNDSSA